MKLTDLDPRWLEKDGKRVGLIFRCPLQPDNAKRMQAVFFRPTPPTREQWAITAAVVGQKDNHLIQHCNPDAHWDCAPPADEATFDNISITPSIDGSAGGNWHGHITNGAIVGGIP